MTDKKFDFTGQLLPGTKWITRDGRKLVVWAIEPPRPDGTITRWPVRVHLEANGQWVVGGRMKTGALSLGRADRADIVAPAPLEIATGKYYRMRNGRKAYVAARALEEMGSMEFPLLGYIEKKGGGAWSSIIWDSAGSYYGTDQESGFDLVAEWEDE